MDATRDAEPIVLAEPKLDLPMQMMQRVLDGGKDIRKDLRGNQGPPGALETDVAQLRMAVSVRFGAFPAILQPTWRQDEMSISMYQASIPTLVHVLGNLDAILAKAAAHAEAKRIDPSVLVNSRLCPDMFPLARQIQIATDMAKGCAARLAGQEPPKYEDTEASFPELSARIQKTIAYLESANPDTIDGSEERSITLKLRDQSVTFQGMAYLLNFVLPNFYFHVTTAYAILRHNGVDLGKQDYLGKIF